MKYKFLFAALLSFSTLHGISQAKPDEILVKKTEDFEVTGDGSSAAWQKTQAILLPKVMGKVNYGTTMKILYSDRGIYLYYQCEDRSITSTLKEDFADIFNEDVVEAFFWPEEKTVIYFEYELSPYNFELPILVPNYNMKFYGWRPWHYEGHRKTVHKAFIQKNGDKVTGWSGEVFIPFDLLVPLQNVPPHSGTTWRANFYRIDYDDDPTEWAWKTTGPSFHEYEKFGRIVFE